MARMISSAVSSEGDSLDVAGACVAGLAEAAAAAESGGTSVTSAAEAGLLARDAGDAATLSA